MLETINIKQPWLAAISGVLILVLLAYVAERLMFLRSAERATGHVTNVSAHNATCGSRRSRYPCTKFQATISFRTPAAASYNLSVSSGSSRGYSQPISYSRLRMNQAVGVVYDPKNPAKAYEDTLWGVWAGPILVFFFQIATFFGSLTQPKRAGT